MKRLMRAIFFVTLVAMRVGAQDCGPGGPIVIYDDSGCPPYTNCNSPIVVNLGGGPYQLSGPNSPVAFDINADGAGERIGWTAAGAPMAFLALDRNGNGAIDDGAELFGNHTPMRTGNTAGNGFAALEQYDSNVDGVIDASDAIWASLLLWTDANHDGISQPSEIVPVSESDVIAFGLNYHLSGRRDASGNVFRYQAAVWFRHGRSGQLAPRPVYDVFFVSVP
jgi:hypothetical protein